MPSTFPPGDPAPADGGLPASALEGMPSRTFSVYVHVPFCRVRCGYCDFNTYTLPELGEGERQTLDYATAAHAELALAQQVLAGGRPPAVSTVFLGGGTPTMLAPEVLGDLVHDIRDRFGTAPDAEVTTEANPDTITPAVAERLAERGFTRVSLGMQSAVPHVLRTLDRTHDPANVVAAVAAVRAAGMQVSLDLIYGTPGESLEDWRRSLEAVVELEPDHVSAYALVVEQGTRLAAQVRRGEVPAPDDDDEADKYELADELLGAAGYGWYEISNWSRGPGLECRHNVAYWRGGDWWGVGPGAHSHVGGVRWWNVKHPRAYADRLACDASPAHAREVLDDAQRFDETVLLRSRLAEGLAVGRLRDGGRLEVPGLVADGLVERGAAVGGRVVLTRRGRLLADTVVHRLLRA
ncbi:radical SAM family heme chaperone HemW [Ornithinimicrobium avium]|uniref:Heme chaperone HemW n=1 Tax=Ornithinimicrobium avium TaxID=2283195 RepID=A0A345NIW1_9MICO|nr:radical SAM family heme chaperone HemW [Ornithinimicrobium avium]AXH94969.1 coproporphyrinogen III oxidase [Ornithinimicrobium avium]